jgi:hypothetical protein
VLLENDLPQHIESFSVDRIDGKSTKVLPATLPDDKRDRTGGHGSAAGRNAAPQRRAVC